VIGNPSCTGSLLDGINASLASSPQIQALSGIAVWAKEGWECEGTTSLATALAQSQRVLDFMQQAVQTGSATAGCENATQPRWRSSVAIGVVTSIDPNDKLAVVGTVSVQQALPYTVEFENAPTATASAQNVQISDQLDNSTMDLSTVSLNTISFGETRLYPPPGVSSYATTVDLRPATNLLVTVTASLDAFTHMLTWYFNSIDPATGRTPTSTAAGFLPPGAQASVLFTVNPKSGLATGSNISNGASILFDSPPAITTSTVTNGVDNTPPSSHVAALPGNSDSPTIPVSWSVDAPTPDLRDFTIYVSQDNGPYWVWRLNTPVTGDTLVPPTDHKFHTYSLYSVARDQIGNVEAAPAVPDASTQSRTGVGDLPTARLALAGAWPNPSRDGKLRVALSLASREPATLELLDIAGRRIARREVGWLGPGRHEVALAPAGALAPGFYFLRLTQSGRSLRSRVSILR
jgi:uncharacterized repeat protein (TIGR01451 family)